MSTGPNRIRGQRFPRQTGRRRRAAGRPRSRTSRRKAIPNHPPAFLEWMTRGVANARDARRRWSAGDSGVNTTPVGNDGRRPPTIRVETPRGPRYRFHRNNVRYKSVDNEFRAARATAGRRRDARARKPRAESRPESPARVPRMDGPGQSRRPEALDRRRLGREHDTVRRWWSASSNDSRRDPRGPRHRFHRNRGHHNSVDKDFHAGPDDHGSRRDGPRRRTAPRNRSRITRPRSADGCPGAEPTPAVPAAAA